eukprot:jgi/Botrbrau1/10084/Bobra.0355s0037.1
MRNKSVLAIEVEAIFPVDFPSKPFFLRVISPKIQDYTGFVSSQGAILMECLSEGRGITKWHSEITLDFVLMAWLIEGTRQREYDFEAPGAKAKRTAKPMAIENASAPGYTQEGASSDWRRCLAADKWY